MQTLMGLIALGSLVLTVVFIPIIGAVVFSMVTFVLFVGALVGVIAGLEDHTVRQHNPRMDPRGWRDDQ